MSLSTRIASALVGHNIEDREQALADRIAELTDGPVHAENDLTSNVGRLRTYEPNLDGTTETTLTRQARHDEHHLTETAEKIAELDTLISERRASSPVDFEYLDHFEAQRAYLEAEAALIRARQNVESTALATGKFERLPYEERQLVRQAREQGLANVAAPAVDREKRNDQDIDAARLAHVEDKTLDRSESKRRTATAKRTRREPSLMKSHNLSI